MAISASAFRAIHTATPLLPPSDDFSQPTTLQPLRRTYRQFPLTNTRLSVGFGARARHGAWGPRASFTETAESARAGLSAGVAARTEWELNVRRRAPLAERYGVRVERDISADRIEELGAERWQRWWTPGPCAYRWDWRVEEQTATSCNLNGQLFNTTLLVPTNKAVYGVGMKTLQNTTAMEAIGKFNVLQRQITAAQLRNLKPNTLLRTKAPTDLLQRYLSVGANAGKAVLGPRNATAAVQGVVLFPDLYTGKFLKAHGLSVFFRPKGY
ncbi:unnamed protein product [Closterium sp. NIES-54]